MISVPESPRGPVLILVDGACPLCRSEGAFLQWLDAGRRRVMVEDITSASFDPSRYGLSMEQVMGQMHGIGWDGRIYRGMEVFRQAYAAVGLGWLLAPTGWPLVRPVVDAGYRWFARHRLRLTRLTGACRSDRCHHA